jgi:signal transduction histidine kinase
MKSIGTKFSLAVGVLAALSSGIVLWRARDASRHHLEDLTEAQARLALEFDVALREYAGEAIRPEVEKRIPKDDFIVEAMSTSYIARRVFEKVRKSFPEYLIRFPSDNPRNPQNRAGPEEQRLLAYFRDNPQAARWAGTLEIGGAKYQAYAHAMRIEESCLRCHGQVEDSPKVLLERYGTTGGFHRKLGEVAGMDVVAIPVDRVNAALDAEAWMGILTTAICLAVLFGLILIVFRYLVERRLRAITSYFEQAAVDGDSASLRLVDDRSPDEIGVLARSFNALAERVRGLHQSLEDRVQARTAELQREQQTLKHLLQSSDHERQMLAYEIHDGLAQELAGAIMHLQTAEHLREARPREAAQSYEAGISMLHRSLAEARRVIAGVRPPILDEFGVVAAIEHLVQDRIAQGSTPHITFQHRVEFDRLAPTLENAIYRIVQESLSNAIRHSQSERVAVELTQQGDWVRILVQDWGRGFRPAEVGEGCFGLEGIRERARLLGGTAQIDGLPGQGARIQVELPITLRETVT